MTPGLLVHAPAAMFCSYHRALRHVVLNIYKTFFTSWPANDLDGYDNATVYSIDFKIHHNLWSYNSYNETAKDRRNVLKQMN